MSGTVILALLFPIHALLAILGMDIPAPASASAVTAKTVSFGMVSHVSILVDLLRAVLADGCGPVFPALSAIRLVEVTTASVAMLGTVTHVWLKTQDVVPAAMAELRRLQFCTR